MRKRYWNLCYLVGVVVLVSLSGRVPAQDLSTLGQQKPVTLNGGLSVRTVFYSANGIQARRKPFSYVVTGAPVVSLYGWSIPVSFVFSEQERSFRQPFNQFGMSPTYKWITLHAGYRNLNFSPYTLAGHTMLGGGVELKPGIFRFGLMYGRLNRATAVDTTSGSLEPFRYTRMGYALKLGVGNRKASVDFSVVKAKDDSTSASAVPDAVRRQRVAPAENAVFGLTARVTFLKQFYWEGDGGLSLYTRNLGSAIRLDTANLLPDILTSTLGKFLKINGSTEFYSAYQTSVGYRGKVFSLRLQYRRIDPGYQSMGAYFFNNDVENVTITPSVVLWKQRLRLSGSLGLQRDNLQNQKQATSRRVIGAANVSADFTDQWGLDLNFTNFSTNQRARTILVADSFLLAQTTQNLSITPRYILVRPGVNHVLLLSYNRMTLTDQNDRTAADNNIQSNNTFFNYQLTFPERGLSFSLNLNSTQVNLAAGKNGNEGVTLGITKRLMDNKLSIGLTNSVLRGTQGGGNSTIQNHGIRADVQASKKHRLNALLNFIGNSPTGPTDRYNTRYTEFRGELGYNFSF
ncbi:MAG: hypothetical protein H7Z75_17170 [Ferruginibacter sp.]|nr:hypothetical protein [Cytophagales bacterium]